MIGVGLLVIVMLRTAMALRPVIFVTGSTDGIGLTTAKNVAKKGYDVLLHGRDPNRIARAKETVQTFAPQAKVVALPPADLATVQGSRDLCHAVAQWCQEENAKLSAIMNNAGVFADNHVVTDDNLELTFAVNVVAPFVITSLLLDHMETAKGRIVIASSISQCGTIRDWDDLQYQNRRFSSHAAYSESKLLDAMLTMEFAERLQLAQSNVTCNCLDPGTVNTKMLLAGWGPCGISVRDALDETWLCTSSDVEGETGRYYVYKSDSRASAAAYDTNERQRLWSILSELAPDAAKVWDSLAKK